ncbi:hypothetical protein Sango_2431900 [Sesamum angolense]|uniref:Retrovirus-related Pol polyprotein from transposon TNT 1-94-like beta-barrel domain-containing protein n=1 Tax=Sesamum angolense TaxID=2727404 RepID=A0AAE1W7J5_9LAMI|nr:hypothetical protein Sango_2431900 [Sesamum angolense]
MNGLEKSIHELINMLVQYEGTTHKSAPTVLVGEASTSKAKGKRAGCWKWKKGKGKVTTTTASPEGAPAASSGKGKGKEKVGGSQRSKANDVCIYCQGNEYWKRECPQLLSNPGIFVIEVNMTTNVASWILDTGCRAHICNNLQVLERSKKLSKDEMILRLGDGKAVAAEAVGSLNLVIKKSFESILRSYCQSSPDLSLGHGIGYRFPSVTRIFSFSLCDNAKDWLQSLPAFDRNHYMMHGNVSRNMLRRCPHHELPMWRQIQTFYNSLTLANQATIDAAAGDTIMKKLSSEAFNITNEIATNLYSYGKRESRKE